MPYIGTSPSNGVRRVHTYTATASQTIFTGASSEGVTLSYADTNYIDVFQNGVLLGSADYTSTSGTSVVLSQGASADDLLVVIVYDIFSVADTVSKTNGGTFDGAVTLAGGVSGNTTFSGEIITSTSGTSNVRIGENAGDAIASGAIRNVVVGDEAGTAITTGDENTFVGYATGDATTTGIRNIAIGGNALGTNVAGDQSVAIGFGALFTQNPSGNADMNNVAIGYDTGFDLTTGIQNTLIGATAGDALTDADFNVAIGYQALSADTKGSLSTAVGKSALANQNFTSATNTFNTGIGAGAGEQLTTGIYNTLVGGVAGDALTDADYNVAIGGLALTSDTQGSNSVAVGYRALTTQNNSSATQANNTAIGTNAGASVTDGINNVFVGHGAGAGHQSGDHSIYIGRDAGYHATPMTTGSYNILIGSFTDGDANDTGAMIVMGYNVTSVGGSNFTFGNNVTDSNIAFGATSITAPSDERYKEEITTSTAGLSFINDLRPVTFKWKKEKDIPSDHKSYVADSDERVMGRGDKVQHGFIAQEVKAVIDKHSEIKNGFEMWQIEGEEDGDGRQRLAPSELIPMLVKAIQELSTEVTALKTENATQATQIADLISRVTALESAE
jgi:hypothetical protein